jgi:hypothetical protein
VEVKCDHYSMTSKSKKRAAKRAANQLTTNTDESQEESHQKSPPTLKLAVFDLDYTIWKPEMYQLSGPPKLTAISDPKNRRLTPSVLEEAKTRKDGYILTDRRHKTCTHASIQGSLLCIA